MAWVVPEYRIVSLEFLKEGSLVATRFEDCNLELCLHRIVRNIVLGET
jgi:hypothetical protein